MESKLKPMLDRGRHLICIPYSVKNLHALAEQLGIARCWYHPGHHPHYDIPRYLNEELKQRYGTVTPREIVKVIQAWHKNDDDYTIKPIKELEHATAQ